MLGCLGGSISRYFQIINKEGETKREEAKDGEWEGGEKGDRLQ